MRKLVLILYLILVVAIVISIVTGHFSPGLIKAEALFVIVVTAISVFFPGRTDNSNNNTD